MLRENWYELPLQVIRAHRNQGAVRRTWGVRNLDELCPLEPGDLVVIGVDGSVEASLPTSAVALRLAFRLAGSGRVALFTPTSATELGVHALSAVSGVEPHRLRFGFHTRDDESRIFDAAEELQTSGVFIDDRLGLSWSELDEEVCRFVGPQREGMAGIVIERPETMVEAGQSHVALSARMKRLAMAHDVPVLAIVRSDPRAGPLDAVGLPGHGAIAREADLVAITDCALPPSLCILRSSRAAPSCVVRLDELADVDCSH